MDKRLMVYEESLKRAEVILEGDSSVIIDATFVTQSLRKRAAALAVKYEKTFVILHTQCPREISIARILKRTEDDYESNALTEQAYINNEKKFEKVDLTELKSVDPNMKILYFIVDTQHDLPDDWYVIAVERA